MKENLLQKLIIWLIITFILPIIPWLSQSYYFWLKSSDNTPENIIDVEKTTWVKLPIISFIFDPREKNDVLNSIDKIVDLLWTDRIYHFTLSPDNFSADEVIAWKFDSNYTSFFKKIKEKDLHVIFRTMHEMNGGRYPRSSNPEKFKAARIHVRSLSRTVWLTEENIAFDFSVNHRDMPTNWTPSQTAPLTECNITKTDCYHFEDYYPGDEFVDVIWFTFYNRWKASSNRQRLTPTQILYDKNWNTYERIKAFNKPIVIDEVATTSVRYEWNYDHEKSKSEYLNHDQRKDLRLWQLWTFLVDHPEIVATIYFNVDYTHWLRLKLIWEADRAIVNLDENKIYNWFENLESFWEKNLDNILYKIFNTKYINIDWHNITISLNYEKEIKVISSIINKKSNTILDKIAWVQKLQTIDFGSNKIDKSLDKLLKLYIQIAEEENII